MAESRQAYVGGLRVVPVSGTAYERGHSYGRQVRREIRRLLIAYSDAVKHYAGIDWPQAVAFARGFRQAIADRAPHCAEEMSGIADGAGVSFDDVLALNCRSELLYGYPCAGGSVPAIRAGDECTALAILPEKSAEGHTVLGQNWDWLVSCADSVVLLVARRDDGPDFFTVVEAGLLAKSGVNGAGLGLCTNTLIADGNLDLSGLPYHVLLRQCLDDERVSDAVTRIMLGPRAVAGNYLLAHGDGVVVDVESLPGTVRDAAAMLATDGVLCHSNHVLSGRLQQRDAMLERGSGTLVRYDRARRAVAGPRPSAGDLLDAFRDHANFPVSVCLHPNPAVPELERSATLSSVVYDLTSGNVLIARGNPCSSEYAPTSLGELISGADWSEERQAS